MTPVQYTNIGLLIAKGLTVIGLILYAIYAGIMFRQEQLMSKVLADKSEGLLRVLTLAHLGAALFVVALALIIL